MSHLKARMQRANILLKQGVFDQAIDDYQYILIYLNFERYLPNIIWNKLFDFSVYERSIKLRGQVSSGQNIWSIEWFRQCQTTHGEQRLHARNRNIQSNFRSGWIWDPLIRLQFKSIWFNILVLSMGNGNTWISIRVLFKRRWHKQGHTWYKCLGQTNTG